MTFVFSSNSKVSSDPILSQGEPLCSPPGVHFNYQPARPDHWVHIGQAVCHLLRGYIVNGDPANFTIIAKRTGNIRKPFFIHAPKVCQMQALQAISLFRGLGPGGSAFQKGDKSSLTDASSAVVTAVELFVSASAGPLQE